jgi:UDP-N-acetylmuramoyl-L-alanyl-D-glutamate--2,6-diaminopimelate ligase
VDEISMLGENGVRFSVIHGIYRVEGAFPNGRTDVYCGIPGEFSAYNSLLAFAVLCELGVPPLCASGGITACSGVRGRMEKLAVPAESGVSVIIDFAHTPDALSRLLRSVRSFCDDGNRIVTVFGCGGDRDRSKRSLMGAIASRLSDFTVITADNSRSESTESIINDILSGFDRSRPHKVISDRREAIEYVLENSAIGDVILLCGKGHEEYEIRGGERYPFSERKIVAEYFSRTVGDCGGK